MARQEPHAGAPGGTGKAHRSHRATGTAKRSRQGVQTRPRPQPWQMAHRLGHGERPVVARAVRANGQRASSIVSIYFGHMAAHDPFDADRTAARQLDPAAAARAVRRTSLAAEPPWLHTEVARRLGERLVPMRIQPPRLLDWWARNGAGAAVLRAAYPRAEWVAVEPSALDDSKVEARRSWWSLMRSAGPRASDLWPDERLGRAQIVWANMALHFVADPPALFARWHRLLDVDGLVVFSCLGPGTLRELRELYAQCGWPAPTPGYIDMHDLGDMLVAAGFADPVLDQETITLRWKTAEALLAALRALGGNTAPDRFPGLRTPVWRGRLIDALRERTAADGGISLSIEIAYGHGFKPAPRLRAGEPVTVSLDEMRAMARKPRR